MKEPTTRAGLQVAARRTSGFRSPGERAFDRCFFLTLSLLTITVFQGIAAMESDEKSPVPAASPAFLWAVFVFGILLSAHWIWALASVVAAWRDPFARVLRCSAGGLLLLTLPGLLGMLTLPWRAAR